jgi:hypothetical protein
MAGACGTNDVSTASRELQASPSASAPGSAGPILFDVL